MSFFTDIADFHQKFDLTYDGNARQLPNDLIEFRIGFMQEELDEYVTHASETAVELTGPEGDDHSQENGGGFTPDKDAVVAGLEGQLDALVDLVYVALGTAYLQGFKFEEAWARVHAANMRKKRAEPDGSDSKRGSPNDVVKPEGWVAPSHTDLVIVNNHFPLP
jgi:predicted HAD superfamily Cof-like phosphohydrolase